MPQSSDYLKDKFMSNGSDGIMEAESIIKKLGGEVVNGVITIPLFVSHGADDTRHLNDAVDFLVDEWDYGMTK